jgi:hypothetical protein
VTRTQRQIEELRQGEACVLVCDPSGRPLAGDPVWAEQETHAFAFGCVAPDLDALPEPDRARCLTRLHGLFNRLLPAGPPTEPGVIRVDVPDAGHLGQLRTLLDRMSSAGRPLEVHVRGRCVGLGGPGEEGFRDRAAAERVAALYTLCFAHPAVGGVFWNGFWDGEAGAAGGGLLRIDLAPRPAYRFLHKLIGTVWHSRAAGATDRDGLFRFRGFFGDYRVAARIGDGPATTALIPCRPGIEGPQPLRIPSPAGTGGHRSDG